MLVAGVRPWLWTVDPGDWEPGVEADQIVQRLDGIVGGDVILLHDAIKGPLDARALDRRHRGAPWAVSPALPRPAASASSASRSAARHDPPPAVHRVRLVPHPDAVDELEHVGHLPPEGGVAPVAPHGDHDDATGRRELGDPLQEGAGLRARSTGPRSAPPHRPARG